MAETNRNLWAPWRMEYIRSLVEQDGEEGCFLCRYAQSPDKDGEHQVVWRTDACLTVFNRFPYSNGHLLVAPFEHLAELEDLEDPVFCELFRQVRDAKRLLAKATCAHGFNVGMNFGRCAGAGLPGHLHVHVVPRWDGDTNFMPVVGDVRVISQSTEALREEMRAAARELGLPDVRGD
jgi:ATP adenylyltransferase